MCNQTDEEPGPPLNEKVIGRSARLVALPPSLVYAIKKKVAWGFPSSSLITIVPAVARYLISTPLIVTELVVSESSSLGSLLSDLDSSFLGSSDFLSVLSLVVAGFFSSAVS